MGYKMLSRTLKWKIQYIFHTKPKPNNQILSSQIVPYDTQIVFFQIPTSNFQIQMEEIKCKFHLFLGRERAKQLLPNSSASSHANFISLSVEREPNSSAKYQQGSNYFLLLSLGRERAKFCTALLFFCTAIFFLLFAHIFCTATMLYYIAKPKEKKKVAASHPLWQTQKRRKNKPFNNDGRQT